MPIQGNGMHTPSTPAPKAADPAPATDKVDPITAAVTAAVGKTQSTVNATAKEDKPVEAAKEKGLEKATGEAPVGVSDEGVVFDPEMPRDQLERAMLARIHPPEKPAYVPPPPNERMMGQLEAEQAAGRARVQYANDQYLRRPKAAPEPGQGTNVEVLRAREYRHETGNPSKGHTVENKV